MLTPEPAGLLARMTLANIAREYPSKLDHVSNGRGDGRTLSALPKLAEKQTRRRGVLICYVVEPHVT
jgi:hypothetical protein